MMGISGDAFSSAGPDTIQSRRLKELAETIALISESSWRPQATGEGEIRCTPAVKGDGARDKQAGQSRINTWTEPGARQQLITFVRLLQRGRGCK